MDAFTGRLSRWVTSSSLSKQAVVLFLVDSFTNVIDYGFHIFLGRALAPGDFAAVQALNGALLIVLTAAGVFQPAVARQVVEASDGEARGALFRGWFWTSELLGLGLSLLVWLGRRPIAGWLGLDPTLLGIVALGLLVALTRPVVAGVLQGGERFFPFGAIRAVYALSRLVIALILVSLGLGAVGAVAAMPLAGLFSLLAGLAFLGGGIWRRPSRAAMAKVRQGLGLSLAALLGFGAYMFMMNIDLIWANRGLAPQAAGGYATLVLLRRIVGLLPGAAVVVMYPRAVGQVARGRLPDGLLAKTAILVLASGALLTLLYFALGPQILRLTFGARYEMAGGLAGWLGLASIGYGIAALWLNFYLGVEPWPFVAFLLATAAAQALALGIWHGSPEQIIAIFGAAGWSLAVGGLLLYLLWMRPLLRRRDGGGDG